MGVPTPVDRRHFLGAGLLAAGHGLFARSLLGPGQPEGAAQYARLHNTNLFTGDNFFKTKPWADVRAYGAKGDGVADDAPAIQAAIEALGTRGGVVFLPVGTYRCDEALDLDAKSSVTIRGNTESNAGATAASVLNFTQGGSAPLISAQSSYGVTLSGLQILYASGSFTGSVVDYRGLQGHDTAYGRVEHCYLGGNNSRSAGSLIALDKAIDMSIRHTTMRDAAAALLGQAVSSYSNRILVQDCQFDYINVAAVKNAGDAWCFVGNTFEGGMYGARGVALDVGVAAPRALSFLGNWFGDVAPGTGSVWLDLAVGVNGFSFLGNFLGGVAASTTGIRVGADGCAGILIAGNQFTSLGTGVDFGSTTGHTGVMIGPNSYGAVTTRAGGTIPDGLIEDPTSPTRYRLLSAATLRTEHVGSAVPSGGSSGDLKVGSGKLWVNDAGTWKSVPLG
jgi:Pectate lyase superfamily protein